MNNSAGLVSKQFNWSNKLYNSAHSSCGHLLMIFSSCVDRDWILASVLVWRFNE